MFLFFIISPNVQCGQDMVRGFFMQDSNTGSSKYSYMLFRCSFMPCCDFNTNQRTGQFEAQLLSEDQAFVYRVQLK